MDHLVFASPDLDEGVRHVERLLGVTSAPGGQHHGLGTRNRLIGLGADCYMEVVSIDPEQPDPDGPRWFGLDSLEAPRLVSWCAKSRDLDALGARARAAGIDLGDARSGGRTTPDGIRLTWTFTDPWAERAGGVIPFFIDWGATTHPAVALDHPCTFQRVRLEHPDATNVGQWAAALGLDVDVMEGEHPAVIALIDSPNGLVELR